MVENSQVKICFTTHESGAFFCKGWGVGVMGGTLFLFNLCDWSKLLVLWCFKWKNTGDLFFSNASPPSRDAWQTLKEDNHKLWWQWRVSAVHRSGWKSQISSEARMLLSPKGQDYWTWKTFPVEAATEHTLLARNFWKQQDLSMRLFTKIHLIVVAFCVFEKYIARPEFCRTLSLYSKTKSFGKK